MIEVETINTQEHFENNDCENQSDLDALNEPVVGSARSLIRSIKDSKLKKSPKAKKQLKINKERSKSRSPKTPIMDDGVKVGLDTTDEEEYADDVSFRSYGSRRSR